MSASTQAVPGYYVWQPEGSSHAIHIKLDVIDRLGPEIMKGFGAVPKRGAEVGGLLLGSIHRGENTVIRIDDFEPVACQYKRGPSFLLSEEDGREFHDTLHRAQRNGIRPPYAVGFYRSHTRDGSGLGPEDLDILNRCFPDPFQVAMIVRPFATKPSMAGFFVRESDGFETTTKLEFPFRRFNLTGEEAPRRRGLEERRARDPRHHHAPIEKAAPAEPASPELFKFVEPPKRSRFRVFWVWIPVSMLLILVGMLLGFQAALTMAPKLSVAKESDFRLSLNVTRTEDNLTVHWDKEAPVVRAAARGTIEINDGESSKSVDLDYANLQSGSIIYRNSADAVRFRLIVYLNANLSVTESFDWSR